MEGRFDFTGKGKELFFLYLKNIFFTVITLGIFFAWAKVNFLKYYAAHTTFKKKEFKFEGKGSELFFIYIFHGVVLCVFTFGFYYPWFLIKENKYLFSRLFYDDESFNLNCDMKEYYFIVWGINVLTIITLGVYSPWGYLRIMKFILSNTYYKSESFDIRAGGGAYCGLIISQVFLSIMTLGVYTPVAVFTIKTFLVSHIYYGDDYIFRNNSTSLEYFKKVWKGILLIIITLGIYSCWIEAKLKQFFISGWELSKREQIDL